MALDQSDRFKLVVTTGRAGKLVANGVDAFNGKVFTARFGPGPGAGAV